MLHIRREHVESSMRLAGLDAVRPLSRGMYASLGTGIFELLWMSGRPREALASRVLFAEGALEKLRKSQATGRGVVVATAHTGNWDLVACASAQLGPLTVVTKRLSVGFLDSFWQRTRALRGVRLVDAEGASAKVGAALREGGMVALMVDQVPERPAGFVELPFLGRMARCDLTPATLAARNRSPLLVALGRRLEDGTHLVCVPLVLEPPARPSRAWILDATAEVQRAVEACVREHPSQWLWLHRRWKLVNDAPQLASSSSASAALASSTAASSAPASLPSQTESWK